MGLKANADGSGAIQVGGSDAINLSVAGVIGFNSGYGSVATAYGCRAWVNFNGTGTVAIRASGNVSSITDSGVGNYIINFTTIMPDLNYAALVNAQASATLTISNANGTNRGAGGVQIFPITNLAGTPVDPAYVDVSIFR